VLEAAGAQEGFIDGRQMVLILIERTANRVEVAKRRMEFEVRGSRPLRRNSSSKPRARELIRPSHTDGVTTAPASISSSAHASRVKACSRLGSKLSP